MSNYSLNQKTQLHDRLLQLQISYLLHYYYGDEKHINNYYSSLLTKPKYFMPSNLATIKAISKLVNNRI